MAIGFDNNDYGITRKEFREFKREMKKLDRESDAIELTRKDYKEIKAHIKNGDLGAYMENVGEEMRAAMGLKLSNKVDIGKEIAASLRILHDVNLGKTPDGKDVDVAKVSEFIKAADASRIEQSITGGFAPQMTNVEISATEARMEQFFNSSPFMQALDNLN